MRRLQWLVTIPIAAVVLVTAGTFAYHCTIHSYMKGTITVLAAGQNLPATDAATLLRGAGRDLSVPSVLLLIGAGMLLLAVLLTVWRRAAESTRRAA